MRKNPRRTRLAGFCKEPAKRRICGLASARGLPKLLAVPDDLFSLEYDSGGGDAVEAFRRDRQRALDEFARATGLPVGRRAEVALQCGINLRGILLLEDEELFVPTRRAQNARFRINSFRFGFDEIASVVAME